MTEEQRQAVIDFFKHEKSVSAEVYVMHDKIIESCEKSNDLDTIMQMAELIIYMSMADAKRNQYRAKLQNIFL